MKVEVPRPNRGRSILFHFEDKYKYYDENGKPHAIVSIDIDKLKEKVLACGLLWINY